MECEFLEGRRCGFSCFIPGPFSVFLYHPLACSLTSPWTAWHFPWSSVMSSSFLPLDYYTCSFFGQEGSFLTSSSGWFFFTVQSQLKCYLLTEAFPWPMSFESLPQSLSMALNDTRNYLLVLRTLIAFILLRIRAGTLSVLFTWFLHSVVWHRVGTQ